MMASTYVDNRPCQSCKFSCASRSKRQPQSQQQHAWGAAQVRAQQGVAGLRHVVSGDALVTV